MEQPYLKLKKNRKYNGIELTKGEVTLLKVIYDVKILSARNMHLSYGIQHDNKRKPNAVSNRLSKLLHAGILKRIAKPTEYNTFDYYYNLGARGFWILEQEGYLTAKQVEIRKKYQYATKTPPTHNEGLAACIVHLMATLQKKEVPLETIKTSERGELSSHFLMDVRNRLHAEIVPDWVIETEKHLICLEIDTGNQSHSVIRSKYMRYEAFLVRRNIEKTLLVIFVSLDASSKTGSPRLKRIGSLKGAFPPMEEWPQKLELFVVPSSRLSDVLVRILTGKLAFLPDRQEELCNSWLKRFKEQLPSLHIRPFSKAYKEEFMNGKFSGLLLLGAHVRKESPFFLAAAYAEEGCVRSHQRMEKIIGRVKKWSSNSGHDFKLVVIYETPEAAEGDVLGIKPLDEMYGAGLSRLDGTSQDVWEYPFAFQFLSPYKKKKLSWID